MTVTSKMLTTKCDCKTMWKCLTSLNNISSYSILQYNILYKLDQVHYMVKKQSSLFKKENGADSVLAPGHIHASLIFMI